MDTDKLKEPFYCILSICRADLQGILPDEQIARLDDIDMQMIADKMGDAYCENGFWTDLGIIAEHVLATRG